ncbi:MAG: hypothetical protein E7086_06285 [Bacteroidales bacterium]|nr:hypothetical protein [Bacteroidales bacterium]
MSWIFNGAGSFEKLPVQEDGTCTCHSERSEESQTECAEGKHIKIQDFSCLKTFHCNSNFAPLLSFPKSLNFLLSPQTLPVSRFISSVLQQQVAIQLLLIPNKRSTMNLHLNNCLLVFYLLSLATTSCNPAPLDSKQEEHYCLVLKDFYFIECHFIFALSLTRFAFRNPPGMSFAHASCDLLLQNSSITKLKFCHSDDRREEESL